MADDVLRTLVGVCGSGLAVLDGAGCFVGLNPAAAEILGFPVAELVGRSAPFANGPPAAGPAGVPLVTTWTGPGGRRRDLDYRLAPLPGDGAAVWFSDVTEVRRQQERLTAIVRAASSVAAAGSLRATLDAVAREIVMTANIAAVQILALDDPQDEVRVLGMAGFGDAADFTERFSACRRLGAHVRFLDALGRIEPVVVPHRKPAIMSDPAWAPLHEIMDHPEWDGFASMPLVVRDRTLGVINAYYVPGEDPGPHSLAFLKAMADHAAVAIDTARLLAQSRSQARLEERRRLARDLHDSVVQRLFSMRMQATALRNHVDRPDPDPAQLCSSAEELAELAQSALSDLRRLIFELRPLDLTEHGLVGAVRAHAASVEARTGLAVDVRAPANVELDLDIDLQEDLYRIISEALHNVVKHAGATEVTVCVADADAGGLIVEVSDDGAGPHPGAGPTGGATAGIGLVSMRERAERWGGQLTAGPNPEGGWTVRVALPERGRPAGGSEAGDG
jgi:signal transduction histidine kinase